MVNQVGNRFWIAFILLFAGAHAYAQTGTLQGFCETGGVKVITQGTNSTTTVQASYPKCSVTVYLTATTTNAPIYRDKTNTPLDNPFTATTNGFWLFYSATGVGYDVVLSGGTPIPFPQPSSLTDLFPGSAGGGGGGSGCAEGTCVVNNPIGSQTVIQPAGTGFTLVGSDSVSPFTVVMPTQIHGSLQQDSGNARFSNNVEVDGTLLVEQLATFNANVTVNGYTFTTGNIGITDEYASLGNDYSFGGLGDVNTRGALNAVGGLGAGQRTVTTSTQMDGTDYSVFANATASAVTVTLPDATSFSAIPMPSGIDASGITNGFFSVGRMFIIKKVDSSVNAVTVAATSGQTIDGRSSVTLSSQYGFVIVQTDGANWNLISSLDTGGGVTVPSTTAVLKGNGSGGISAATVGTDYAAASEPIGAAAQTTANTALAKSLPSGTGIVGVTSGVGGLASSPAIQTAIGPAVYGAYGCPVNTPTEFCITQAPYFASTAGGTSTTTTAAFAAGTSGSVASCSTFLPGNGVYIPGAGPAGNFQYAFGSTSGTGYTPRTSGGSFTVGDILTIVQSGASGGQIEITSVASSGITTGFRVIAPGTGYTPAANLTTTGGTGTGLLITITDPQAYIGTVSTCTGTTLTLTTATTNSVASGVKVQHDETAAIQSAITAVAALGGGKIYFPDGIYLVNGNLQNQAGANAVLTMPNKSMSAAVPITLEGLTLPIGLGATAGAFIETATPSGNFIGGYFSGSTFGGFTGVSLNVTNLRLRSTLTNPGVVMLNETYIAEAHTNNVWIDSLAPGTPTNPGGAGIVTPTLSNDVSISADNLSLVGFYTLGRFSEHSTLGQINGANGHDCFVFDTGGQASAGMPVGNLVTAAHIWAQLCTNMIVGGNFITPINITVNSEVAISNTVYDPKNVLRGVANVNVPYTDGRSTSTPTTPFVTGGTSLNICNLQTAVCSKAASSTSTFPPFSGLVENWLGQEGLGSTLVNSGYDFTNSATATNVTWSSATGFTGNVAHYNGTSSFSKAASAANTAFDGTLPFSVCTYFTPTTLAGSSQWIIDDFQTTNTAGWGMENLNTAPGGLLAVFLISNVGTNMAEVVTTSKVLTAGTPYLGCFAYDPSKATGSAGVSIYVNGIAQATTVQSNTLTGSMASTSPVFIGAQGSSTTASNFFPGAIGRTRIYNRLLSAAEMLAMANAGSTAF